MKLVLTQNKKLETVHSTDGIAAINNGWVNAKVLYCGICRSDARLWEAGHRDLTLPRVPGHEIVVEYKNRKYIVWPGISCKKCSYCEQGRENLCDEIKIMGFNYDGGFSKTIEIPEDSLIMLPDEIPAHLGCFAEPMGCVINAFEKLNPEKGKKIIIIGAGVLGMLAALMAGIIGLQVTLVEKREEKQQKAQQIIQDNNIKLVKENQHENFDYAINACNDMEALALSLTALKKGGAIVHFSGITGSVNINSDLINLLHYKELSMTGSYGLAPSHIKNALKQIIALKEQLQLLVEGIIKPTEVEEKLMHVAGGDVYKYIIDFRLV